MGYITDFEQELRERLGDNPDESLIQWLKDTQLQSYRNGLAAQGSSGEQGKTPGSRYAKRPPQKPQAPAGARQSHGY